VRIRRSFDCADFRHAAFFAVLAGIVERIEFLSGADGIDVALRQDCAEPGLQRAAPVKISK
jgi:hypothetical protein